MRIWNTRWRFYKHNASYKTTDDLQPFLFLAFKQTHSVADTVVERSGLSD